ncbi:MAG: M17 family metallopeptidase [Mycoplasmatales bacterium]
MFDVQKFSFVNKKTKAKTYLKIEDKKVENYELNIYNNKKIIELEVFVSKAITNKKVLELGEKLAKEITGTVKFTNNSSIDIELLLESIILTNTDPNVLKTTYKKPVSLKVVEDTKLKTSYKRAYNNAYSYNVTRILNHLPHSVCNPDFMVKEIKKLFKDDKKVKVSVFRTKECKTKKFVGLLSLAQGSNHQPAMVKIEYKNSSDAKIGLVGKGVTFDAGGYNIKHHPFHTMKTDMAGCNAVVGTMSRIVLNKEKVNVTAYLPITDNLINEKATCPGDVITYPNKTSVEIINTDAEGRLILADGLIFASKDKCEQIIDIATLTGAMVAAMGTEYAGYFTNSQKISTKFTKLNKSSSERVWEFPLVEEYNQYIKGDISDIANLSSNKYAGHITAALFLQNFVDCKNWAHIDMAAMSRELENGSPCNGYGVRLLTNYITSK